MAVSIANIGSAISIGVLGLYADALCGASATKIPLGQPENLHQYYEAYYKLARNNSLGAIPSLEAQGSFLRNILLIIPAYVYRLRGDIYLNIESCGWIFLVAIVFLLVVDISQSSCCLKKPISLVLSLIIGVFIIYASLIKDTPLSKCGTENKPLCICLAGILSLLVASLIYLIKFKLQDKVYQMVWEAKGFSEEKTK